MTALFFKCIGVISLLSFTEFSLDTCAAVEEMVQGESRKRISAPLSSVSLKKIKFSDPILGLKICAILSELETQFPLDSDTDLGENLRKHLKGTKKWENSLTEHIEDEIKKARQLNRESLGYLSGSFLGRTLPYYNHNDFIIKVLVQAAKQRYAPALLNLSKIYKNEIKGILEEDNEKAELLYEKSISMDPSVEPSVIYARMDAGIDLEDDKKN